MRLAVAQSPATAGIDDAVAAAIRLVHAAADDGARVLVLSELFIGGYDMAAAAENDAAIAVVDPRLVALATVCTERHVTVLVGAATQAADGLPHNSILAFGADGSIRILYRKAHLWRGERPIFAPGDRGVIVRIDDVTIGLGICYDAGFPEFSRAYAIAGVDAIVFASAFAFGAERDRFHIYHPARALESGAIVVVSNAVGHLGGVDFHGESAIYAADGARAAVVDSAEGVVAVDIQSGSGLAARQALPYLDDRLSEYEPTPIEELQ